MKFSKQVSAKQMSFLHYHNHLLMTKSRASVLNLTSSLSTASPMMKNLQKRKETKLLNVQLI